MAKLHILPFTYGIRGRDVSFIMDFVWAMIHRPPNEVRAMIIAYLNKKGQAVWAMAAVPVEISVIPKRA